MKKNYAVILAGCGYLDGSEIHESVLTLLAIDQANSNYQCFAANRTQHDVISHLDKHNEFAERNIQEESARIARGNIVPVGIVKGEELDGLIFPGGTGMSKNIFDYAMTGPDCTVINDVERLVREIIESGKPIGAICIAPVMVAKVLQNMERFGKLTGGYNESITKDIQSMGIDTEEVGAKDIVVDQENKIVSTPAYVEAGSIKETAEGIEKLVKKIIELTA